MEIIEADLKLDNRQELYRKYLPIILSKQRSDEDILLEGYQKVGEKILYDLVGIFHHNM